MRRQGLPGVRAAAPNSAGLHVAAAACQLASERPRGQRNSCGDGHVDDLAHRVFLTRISKFAGWGRLTTATEQFLFFQQFCRRSVSSCGLIA